MLLLNVNATASTFLPPSNLQDWIQERWGKKIPIEGASGDMVSELRSKRVTFLGDPLKQPKIRSI